MLKKICLISILLLLLNLSAKGATTYDVSIGFLDYHLQLASSNYSAYVTGVNYPASNITVPETVWYSGKEWTVSGIDASAFANQSNITTIKLPSNLTSIGSSAFKNCTNLTKIIIPENVSNTSGSMFSGCTNLKDVIILSSIINAIFSDSFSNCSSELRIAYPDNTKESTVKNLSSYGIVIPFPVNDYILDNDQFIFSKDKSVLYFASRSTSYNLPEETIEIKDKAFQFSNLPEIIFNNKLSKIGSNAFDGCSQLKEIIIPGSVTSIGEKAFANTSNLTNVIFQRAKADLGERNEILINTPFSGSKVMTLSLGRDVSGQYGFGESLQSVELMSTVNYIGETAFKGNTGLISVTIPKGNLSTIRSSAFEGCTNLQQISLPDNVETIENSIFSGCTSLQDVTLSSKTTSIPQNAFYGCEKLNNITLPNSLISIGNSAFRGCSTLPSINLPSGLSEIPPYTFYGCSNLNNISLPEGVKSIGEYAFNSCGSLTQIGLSNIETIGKYAFQNCFSLVNVVFGDKLTAIPDYCFDGCVGLLTLKLPNDVSSIGNYAFRSNSNLTTISLPENLVSIGISSFNGCGELTELIFPSQVKNINSSAFEGCTNLNKIYSLNTLPPSCTNKNVFSDQAYANATLYVPTDYIDDYKYETAWKEFYTKEGLTEVRKIEITSEEEKNRIRVNNTLSLTATITPTDATFTNVKWSSNNLSVATVEDGVVTAVSPGYAVITATATDYTALTGNFEVEVIDFLVGDANMSDYVTVTDAATIASYVLGKNPQPFDWEAADVNGDKDVTNSDALGVISIVLGQPATSSYSLTRSYDYTSDKLLIEDFYLDGNMPVEVPVSLHSFEELIALQGDIFVSEGLEILDVLPSKDLISTHSLTVNRISDNNVRIVLFGAGLSSLPSEPESLFNIKVKGDPDEDALISMTNILATTSSLDEITLSCEGGNTRVETTDINIIGNGNVQIVSETNGIRILNAQDQDIYVYNLSGSIISVKELNGDNEFIQLNSGIYIVRAGDKSAKIIVK